VLGGLSQGGKNAGVHVYAVKARMGASHADRPSGASWFPRAQVDKFYDMIQTGKVFILTKASLLPKKPVRGLPPPFARPAGLSRPPPCHDLP